MGSRSTGTRGMTSLTCEPSLHQAQRAYVHLMGAALGPHERVFVKGLASARSARCFSVRRRPSFENFVSPSRVFLAVSFGTFFVLPTAHWASHAGSTRASAERAAC